MMNAATLLLEALVHVVAPRTCDICGCTLNTGERILCTPCLIDLPRTRFVDYDFNDIHKRLGSTVPVERAAAWYHYDRMSAYADLIRNAKYRDRPRQARLLGSMMASELAPAGFFDGIDLVVPMPMWRWKRLMRGFNQSEEVARGIADVTGIPVVRDVLRARYHSTQARLGAAKRQSNVSGTIVLHDPAPVSGKHVLLVDDIITTGSTMRTAAHALMQANPTALSVAALAMTRHC